MYAFTVSYAASKPKKRSACKAPQNPRAVPEAAHRECPAPEKASAKNQVQVQLAPDRESKAAPDRRLGTGSIRERPTNLPLQQPIDGGAYDLCAQNPAQPGLKHPRYIILKASKVHWNLGLIAAGSERYLEGHKPCHFKVKLAFLKVDKLIL